MKENLNPPGIVTPKNAYSQIVRVRGVDELVSISGQLGVDANGVMAADFRGQVHAALQNIKAALAAVDLAVTDIVHWRHYLITGMDITVFNAERSAFLGDYRPASTLIYVTGMARPEALYEVEAMAVRT